jgi:erythromycin esterase
MHRSVRIAAILTAAWCCTGATPPRDPLQQALGPATLAVRSIDPRDADFTDLAGLVDVIGDARVVMLGEPSHGAGGAFSAKVRLIRFLHQEMGFDVIAWESGVHGMRLAQAALDAGQAPGDAARLGVSPIWSAAAEVQPLFEYVQATRGTARPLTMVGIDPQFTAPGAFQRLETDLQDFVSQARDPELRQQASSHAMNLLAAAEQFRKAPRGQEIADSALRAVTGPADALLASLRDKRATWLRSQSPATMRFMERAIIALRDNARAGFAGRRGLDSESWNIRDGYMADQLRWLLEEPYRGRKVIVWAHNAHIMDGYFAAQWSAVSHEPVPGGMTPLGARLPDLRRQVFSIAFTCDAGEENWVNGQKRGVIAAAPDGSLEARLRALEQPYLFVDLRAAGRRLAGAPLGPMSMRISGLGPPTWKYGHDVVPDLARAFDGAFYIARMTPATAIAENAAR